MPPAAFFAASLASSTVISGVVLTAFNHIPAAPIMGKAAALTLLGIWQTNTMLSTSRLRSSPKLSTTGCTAQALLGVLDHGRPGLCRDAAWSM
jgi:hypothetical protein